MNDLFGITKEMIINLVNHRMGPVKVTKYEDKGKDVLIEFIDEDNEEGFVVVRRRKDGARISITG